jgi:N-terminal domain of anti-restriction factor ArdC
MATRTRSGCRSPRRSAEEMEQARADRQAKVEALGEQLAEAVERLATSEGWLAMLEVAAKFRRYSVNNQLLLWLQAEQREMTLTRVASFGTWKSLGYVVTKGSKGFAILAPVKTRLRPDEVAEWIKEGRNPYDGEGRPRMVVRGFKVEYVFDRSQVELMEGREAPAEPREWISQLGNGPDGLWSALVAMTERCGFSMELRPPLPADGGAHGWTNYATRVVWVNSDCDEAERIRILAHETAGHIRCDHENRKVSRSQGEIEADSVAYIVLAALGLDIASSSVDYVAGWAPGDPKERAEAIREAATTIRATALAVLEDIEGSQS